MIGFVRVLQGFGDLLRDFEGFVNRDRPTLDSLAQRIAERQFHHEEASLPASSKL